MTDEFEQFVAQIDALYAESIIGSSARIRGGARLWRQYEEAVVASREGAGLGCRQLAERVNELAVAKLLADDPSITGEIEYEPPLLPNDRRIDFVVRYGAENFYIEVKTVHAIVSSSEKALANFLKRKKYHPENTSVGGDPVMYDIWFKERSHFLDYTQDFEQKFDIARKIKEGQGIMVFCGMRNISQILFLEDFVGFYQYYGHSDDDMFGPMEMHSIRTGERHGEPLLRNIGRFAWLHRPIDCAKPRKWVPTVRGSMHFWPVRTG